MGTANPNSARNCKPWFVVPKVAPVVITTATTTAAKAEVAVQTLIAKYY
jgi:hypothetical protein